MQHPSSRRIRHDQTTDPPYWPYVPYGVLTLVREVLRLRPMTTTELAFRFPQMSGRDLLLALRMLRRAGDIITTGDRYVAAGWEPLR